MEAFILTKIYGSDPGLNCAEARASKWRKQKKKITLSLPPDSDSLYHHLLRTNYITYCQRHYDLHVHPSPISCGWEIKNGRCRPVRYISAALPDLLLEPSESYDSDNDSTDTDNEDTEYGDSTDSSDEN